MTNLNELWERWVSDFEKFALNQKSADPNLDFDSEYFQGEWRHGAVSYTLESRRKIEGKNPELIKKVFAPSKTLDAGCGPGFLVLMLEELGLDVIGVDASPVAIETVPTQVKERVRLGSVLDLPYSNSSFDLVISREVLEHLTVVELAKTVRELCRVSSKFVYVTTRFAKNPVSFFDVETEFEADPTHITCMTKSALRTLFILEGFKARTDLEKELDWMHKGRVLVYERTQKSLT